MTNTNHPGKEFIILKSTCLELLREVMSSMYKSYDEMGYKSFHLYVLSIKKG